MGKIEEKKKERKFCAGTKKEKRKFREKTEKETY